MARVIGTAGDDDLGGTDGDDIIHGKQGSDRIAADDGNDIIYGEEGVDIIWPGAGDDVIYAGPGSDQVFGGGGNDQLYGRQNGDVLWDHEGLNLLSGGLGRDTLISTMGYGADNTLVGGRESDLFVLVWDDRVTDWSVSWVTDFHPEQGDLIEMIVDLTGDEYTEETTIGTAELFNQFDTSHNGRMDAADDAVAQWGPDLHFSLPNGTVVIQGMDHLDWSMVI